MISRGYDNPSCVVNSICIIGTSATGGIPVGFSFRGIYAYYILPTQFLLVSFSILFLIITCRLVSFSDTPFIFSLHLFPQFSSLSKIYFLSIFSSERLVSLSPAPPLIFLSYDIIKVNRRRV